MEELLSVQTPFQNGIRRWLEGLRDESIRETDRKAEVNSEKKKRNGNNMIEKKSWEHITFLLLTMLVQKHTFTPVFFNPYSPDHWQPGVDRRRKSAK